MARFAFFFLSTLSFVSSLRVNNQRVFTKTVIKPCPSKISALQCKGESADSSEVQPSNTLALAALLTLLPLQDAFAGNYGILEGRTASMAHPVSMFLLLATSVYSATLGFKFRALRESGEQLKQLTSQLPKLSSGAASFPISKTMSSVEASLASLKIDTVANAGQIAILERDMTALKSVSISELDTKYGELSALRKQLISENVRDKHQTTGSILLGVGVTTSILGAFNTYMRAGKLFPGPHLFAGMAMTISWAIAASLIPAMQKGNDAARIAHIGLSVANILLFIWQVGTGLEIMLKVWEKTSWP